MVAGGIILTHDFSFLDGVREAFTEFLRDHPAQLIEMPTSQAMLVCQGEAELAKTVPAILFEAA